MLNDKENIRNLKFITEHNDDQFHLKCDEIELDESDEDQIEKEEEIAYTVDSDEFFALDDEAKLNSLHIAKRHQKRISKEIIAEVSCDYSPVNIFYFSFLFVLIFALFCRINILKFKCKISLGQVIYLKELMKQFKMLIKLE